VRERFHLEGMSAEAARNFRDKARHPLRQHGPQRRRRVRGSVVPRRTGGRGSTWAGGGGDVVVRREAWPGTSGETNRRSRGCRENLL
jgi:hypothetical protein